jgi:hypothetical protein
MRAPLAPVETTPRDRAPLRRSAFVCSLSTTLRGPRPGAATANDSIIAATRSFAMR